MTASKAKNKNQGSALITALFIMTLVAIAATAMSSRMQLEIFRTRSAILSDEVFLARNVVSFWAMGVLSAKTKDFANKIGRGRILELPKEAQHLVPGLVIQGSLYDLQARFNLNNLLEKNYYFIFLKLLQKTLKDSTPETQKELAFALRHWISPYVPGRGQDELFAYYAQQKPPYYPTQQEMQSPSEVRLVKGLSAKIYLTMINFIATLPEITPINLNFAPKKLLLSLGNGLTENEVNEIIEARGERGFIKKEELSKLIDKLHISPETVTLESQYFMSIARIIGQDDELLDFVVFKRQLDKNGTVILSLISESLNTI